MMKLDINNENQDHMKIMNENNKTDSLHEAPASHVDVLAAEDSVLCSCKISVTQHRKHPLLNLVKLSAGVLGEDSSTGPFWSSSFFYL